MFMIAVLRHMFGRQQKVTKQDIKMVADLPAGKAYDVSEPRLHALIIGIDMYAKLRPLTGAVADADAIENFLMADLKVPLDQVTTLRDGSASRAAIVRAFQRLQEDQRIRRGDPILIFYAGHGGLGQAQPKWKADYGYDEVQVIFPCDYDIKLPGSDQTVNCIPDRTVRILLNELAATKGNNIIVIFDCCYSASGSRTEDTHGPIPSRVARDAGVQVSIPYDIDADIAPPGTLPSYQLDTSDPRAPTLPLYTDQASHVHLAACGSKERAWEEEGRGVFTKALLKCIHASGIDKITYQSLLDSFPKLPNQTPHCYGVHKSRILFHARVPPRKTTLIPVKHEQGAWVLQAGIASGVTKSSVWELHDKATEDSQSLGLLHAHTPQVSTTKLEPDPNTFCALEPAVVVRTGVECLYARPTQPETGQKLRVYFSPEAKRLVLSPRCTGSTPDEYEPGYAVRPNRDNADLVVEVCYQWGPTSGDTEAKVAYTMCHPQAKRYGVAKLQQRTRARRDEVEPVLFAAAQWNWHLNRTSSSRARPTISLELIKLGTMYRDYMMPMDGPLENLNKGGVVDIKVQREDQYGIRLSSQASVALYVRAFYFDTTDFSILDMFGHSRANGRPDPDIPARGQLTIGDGSNGGALLSFGLAAGVEIEVGFIKVFWSTDPLELDDVAQESAFMSSLHGEASARKVTLGSRKAPKEWGTVVVTLVQRA